MAIVLSGTTGIDAGSLPVNNCGNTEVEGNLNLSGVGARITGDFSNTTYSNRVAFQSSVTNSSTHLEVLPNGTGGASGIIIVSGVSDIQNSPYGLLQMNSSLAVMAISSGVRGTGTYLPMSFYTGGAERMRIDTAGRVGIGTSNPTTTLDIVGDGRFQQQATSGTSGAIIIKEDSGSVNGGVIQWVNPANTVQRAAIKVKPDYSWEISNNNNNIMFKISSAGDFLATLGTGALGYGTGAGGTVTQLTSKSTSVTLSKPTGRIIMNNAALASNTAVTFQFFNGLISATDNLLVHLREYGGNTETYIVTATTFNAGGGAYITLINRGAISLSDAVQLEYSIIKGAVA